MSQPTKGPWTFARDDDGITDLRAEIFVEDDRPGRIIIAELRCQPKHVQANAALIVAACNACQRIAPENPTRFAEYGIDDLRYVAEAAKHANCDCSIAQRESGHMIGCWFPALEAALARIEAAT